ncbi:MAG: hypothetical protein ACRD6W_00830 [Nitrososphaerales archaeon]
MRFTDIREAISLTEAKIGDRTLSRALRPLLAAGQLRRRAEGKFSYYGLVVQKADAVRAFARAEGAAIESAGTSGGWGDGAEGWAVFGVPPIVPHRFRSRFKRECLRHQGRLRAVLDEVWDEWIDAVLKPARRRVPKGIYVAGEKGILKLLEIQLQGIEGIAYSSRIWQLVEQTVPGTLASFQKSLFPNAASGVPIGEGISLLVSKVSGQPIEEVRTQVEDGLGLVQKRIQMAANAFKPLWDALTVKEQERAGRRLQSASAMTASLTSVVHV